MRIRVFQQMLMVLLGFLVMSGAGARFVDAPTRVSFARLESYKGKSHASVGIEPVVSQVTDPLSAEGKEIDLQSAAAKDWPEIDGAEDAFSNWYGKVSQERQRRNDPGYLRQREESITGELARTKKIRMEKDAKVCRDAVLIEVEIKFTKAPSGPAQEAITVAWNKQFAASVLNEIALELKKCWEWRGKVSGMVSVKGLEYDLAFEVVFRPGPEVLNSLVTYDMTILQEIGPGFNQPQGRCLFKPTGQTTVVQSIRFIVDFKDFTDEKLSYFGLGSSVINTTFECDGKSVPQGFPLFWLFTSADGKPSKAVFVNNPSNKRITGSFSSNGLSGTWDLVRQLLTK